MKRFKLFGAGWAGCMQWIMALKGYPLPRPDQNGWIEVTTDGEH